MRYIIEQYSSVQTNTAQAKKIWGGGGAWPPCNHPPPPPPPLPKTVTGING